MQYKNIAVALGHGCILKTMKIYFLYVCMQYYLCVTFVMHTAYFVVRMYVRIHISNMYLILVIHSSTSDCTKSH